MAAQAPPQDDLAVLVACYPKWGIFEAWDQEEPMPTREEQVRTGRDANGRIFALDFEWNLGFFHPRLYSLTELTMLRLENCQLSGPLPPGISSLYNLKDLDLSFNSLTGPIPQELGALSNLTFLNLLSNRFDGPIPLTLANCTRLKDLNLAVNHLSGGIPAFFDTLSVTCKIRVDENHLGGRISPTLSQLYVNKGSPTDLKIAPQYQFPGHPANPQDELLTQLAFISAQKEADKTGKRLLAPGPQAAPLDPRLTTPMQRMFRSKSTQPAGQQYILPTPGAPRELPPGTMLLASFLNKKFGYTSTGVNTFHRSRLV
ncbi:L domain-like protein [Rhizoclosmatium globosum]|uniref:L domain-like protein n=1 Tax=Rhizoclosmatium globosum TaxID=329046 RepID=A0A1Y2CP44_9FUNG|nr:L domain-like protein [Rhizoclosmatium globosum]|eukprot:ORY48737.1 L domain-like protein [Rhizoclosmatium globosum]